MERGKERILGYEEDQSMVVYLSIYLSIYYTYLWSLKIAYKERNEGSELVQSTLYTGKVLPQWNPLVLLMYANSKI
jgi:hypothetical protein